MEQLAPISQSGSSVRENLAPPPVKASSNRRSRPEAAGFGRPLPGDEPHNAISLPAQDHPLSLHRRTSGNTVIRFKALLNGSRLFSVYRCSQRLHFSNDR